MPTGVPISVAIVAIRKLPAIALSRPPSLPGGGGEILVDRVRQAMTRGKVLTDDWLEVHRQWHALGGRSTATMMYGHIETLAERVEHLERLRQLGVVLEILELEVPASASSGLRALGDSSQLPAELLPLLRQQDPYGLVPLAARPES